MPTEKDPPLSPPVSEWPVFALMSAAVLSGVGLLAVALANSPVWEVTPEDERRAA